jgi:hypothetical protein
VPFSLGDDSIQLADVLDAEFFKDDDKDDDGLGFVVERKGENYQLVLVNLKLLATLSHVSFVES